MRKLSGIILSLSVWVTHATIAIASTAQVEVELPPQELFDAAKRYLLSNYLKGKMNASDLIRVEDSSAGILKFIYRDDSLVDDGAIIEVVELNVDHSKLKVTLPQDFSGRSELLAHKIRQNISSNYQTGGELLPYDARQVYRSALRYLIKEYIPTKSKKEEIIRFAAEDVGLVRFVYQQRNFKDPDARIETLSMGKKTSKLVTVVPSDPGRQILLQDELIAAVKKDLGDSIEDEPQAAP